jgi:hypothetical protein
MPPFVNPYLVNALEMPTTAAARSTLYSVRVGQPTDWAASPAGLTPSPTCGATDASTANRSACASAVADPVTAVINTVSPTTGPAAGGTTVRISGTRFAGATGVNFGSTAETFTVLNDSTITAITPAGTVGAVNLTVVNPNGNGALTGAFTYQ